MKSVSPLRYPGGKSSMSSLLGQIRVLNSFGGRSLAEPYAGGAGASISLLFREEAEEIFINDLDASIYNFWWSLLYRQEEFAELISSTRINMPEWRRQKNIYGSPKRHSRVTRGFSAFFLNRCNRSGIICNGGPIGGVEQKGKWKLNARFNKPDLLQRCMKIAEYNDRIHLSSLDGIEFINSLDTENTFLFIDPPYFHKGKTLYLNQLSTEYHIQLANRLRALNNEAWVLTYDDCKEIRGFYQGWANIRRFTLRYSASERRAGREILITPKSMCLPKSQASLSIQW